VHELNHRFASGGPNNDITRAGVIARLFDPSEKPSEPWLPCTADLGLWCAKFGDRLPASLINKRAPVLYTKGDSRGGGFILNPAHVVLYCAYAQDGSTMNKMCNPPGPSASCMPGCPTGHSDAGWCRNHQESIRDRCAWRPNQLGDMLTSQQDAAQNNKRVGYNELVIDPRTWFDSLPHIISAVFYPSYASTDQKAAVRDVHRRVMKRFGLTSDELPLVVYMSGVGFEVAPT